MKTRICASLLSISIVPVHPVEAVSDITASYIIGGVIALAILGYLIYTLLHPERF